MSHSSPSVVTRLLETLSEEHRLILQAAELALDACDDYGDPGDDSAYKVFSGLAVFFRDFTQSVHRPNEDVILFPWLNSIGEPSIVDMLETLRTEHRFSDEQLERITSLLENLEKERNKEDFIELVELLSSYAHYLIQHTGREEQFLFPVARLYTTKMHELSNSMALSPPPQSLAQWQERIRELKELYAAKQC